MLLADGNVNLMQMNKDASLAYNKVKDDIETMILRNNANRKGKILMETWLIKRKTMKDNR